jgi:hypothetical protein
VQWTTPFKEIFWDLDWTLTGYANGWLTPFFRWNAWAPACVRQGITYDNGLLCDNTVVVRRLQLDYVNPRQLDFVVCVV